MLLYGARALLLATHFRAVIISPGLCIGRRPIIAAGLQPAGLALKTGFRRRAPADMHTALISGARAADTDAVAWSNGPIAVWHAPWKGVLRISEASHQSRSRMRALSIQFSGLVGILTFVSNITSEVALELAVYRGLASAAALFFIMLISDLAIRAIVRSNEPRHALPAPIHTQGLEDHTGALAA